jgi:hypothetical protein
MSHVASWQVARPKFCRQIRFGSYVNSVLACHCEPLGEAVSSYVKAEIASDCVLAMTYTHLTDEPVDFEGLSDP